MEALPDEETELAVANEVQETEDSALQHMYKLRLAKLLYESDKKFPPTSSSASESGVKGSEVPELSELSSTILPESVDTTSSDHYITSILTKKYHFKQTTNDISTNEELGSESSEGSEEEEEEDGFWTSRSFL